MKKYIFTLYESLVTSPPDKDIFVVLRAKPRQVGIVKHLSSKGLIYEYLADLDHGEDFEGEIDIFICGESFYLRKIPCKMVHDKISEKKYPTFLGVQMRHRELQFKAMSKEIQDSLDRFLQHYEAIR